MKNSNNLWLGLILGAIVGGSIVYFISKSDSTSAAEGTEESHNTAQLQSYAVPPPGPAPIHLDSADAWIQSYLDHPDRSLKSTESGADSVLKGCFIEKWVIDTLFKKYRYATGIQCYVCRKPDKTNAFVFGARIKNGGADSLYLSKPNSLYDFSSPCPSACPPVNDLPR